MARVPVPTPRVLWRKPPVLALDSECEWLVTNGVLPASVVTRNRRIAEAALRPWTPVFIHGDLQAGRWLIEHGFDPSTPGCEFAALRSQL